MGFRGTHQNLDLAETSFVAHSFMRNSGGSGSDSVGLWRPTTWYWWRLNAPCRMAEDCGRQIREGVHSPPARPQLRRCSACSRLMGVPKRSSCQRQACWTVSSPCPCGNYTHALGAVRRVPRQFWLQIGPCAGKHDVHASALRVLPVRCSAVFYSATAGHPAASSSCS